MQLELDTSVRSVKQLTNDIKNTLETVFPYLWVKGEVGPVKVHSSGHCYFSLKEEDIVINAICWKGTPLSIELKEGMLVECYSKVTIFGGRSSYQIIAKDVRSVSIKGDIFLKLEELKKKLIAEGIFDLKTKDSIVSYPKKIAILTSPTGAVLHDMIHRIKGRFPCVEVLFFPISVQGLDAQKSIIEALDKVENYNDVDTVILARGGGSLEDLWIFNDEIIVRKVSSLKLPIISAIGHETDTTLVDYASNLRAPTPTAAIEFCVPDKDELTINIMHCFDSSVSSSYDKIKSFKNLLEQFEDHNIWYSNAIDSFIQKVDNIFFIINDAIKDRVKEYEVILSKGSDLSSVLNGLESDLHNMVDRAIEVSYLRVKQALDALNKDKEFIDEKDKDLKEKVIITNNKNERILTKNDIKILNFEKFSLTFLDGSIDVAECK